MDVSQVQSHPEPQPQPERRTFLKVMIHSMGVMITAILGIPIIAYLLDGLNRASAASDFRVVDGIRLNDLQINTPVQGVIRNVRRDAWTLYPNDVIGRVWVVKKGDGLTDIEVFTTVCPHLGCSINSHGDGFRCPCHQASFNLSGTPENAVAPRSMDTLEMRNEGNTLLVRYQNFKQGLPNKEVK